MKKKIRHLLLGLMIPVLAIAGIFYFSNIGNTTSSSNESTLSEAAITNVVDADWKDHFSSVSSMIDGTDLVIKGKVVDSYTEQRVDMIFTKQVIEVTKVYGGDVKIGDKIEILQTGGEMNGINTLPFNEAPLLVKDGEYLLFLEYTNEGHYLIAGGFQGRADLVNDQVIFSKSNYEIANAITGIENNSTASMQTEPTQENPTTVNLSDVEAVLAAEGLNIKD